jgi:hypothetical protein
MGAMACILADLHLLDLRIRLSYGGMAYILSDYSDKSRCDDREDAFRVTVNHCLGSPIRDLPSLIDLPLVNFTEPRTTGTDQPLMPVGNGCLGAVSSRHFGGIGLSLIAAFEAPYDEPNTGSRRAPQRHRWAGFGFHLTSSAVSSSAWRLVMLPLGERFAFRFGADGRARWK